MSSKLKEHVEFELGQLGQLLAEGRNLIESSKVHMPDTTARWALGAMLQAFYNGIENIFKKIASTFDGKLEKSDRWHADLLALMAATTTRRPAVISAETKEILRKYLGFRHLFRGIYTHELRWENMASLVSELEKSLAMFEKEIQIFCVSTAEKQG